METKQKRPAKLILPKKRVFTFELVEGSPRLEKPDGTPSIWFNSIVPENRDLAFYINGYIRRKKLFVDKRNLLNQNDLRSRMENTNGFRLERETKFKELFQERCQGVILGCLKENHEGPAKQNDFFYWIELLPLPTFGTFFKRGSVSAPQEWSDRLNNIFGITDSEKNNTAPF